MCSYILEEKHRNDPKFVNKNLVSHLKPGETTIYTFWRGSSQWGKPGTKSPVDQSPPTKTCGTQTPGASQCAPKVTDIFIFLFQFGKDEHFLQIHHSEHTAGPPADNLWFLSRQAKAAFYALSNVCPLPQALWPRQKTSEMQPL